jgi:hypothetical protein
MPNQLWQKCGGNLASPLPGDGPLSKVRGTLGWHLAVVGIVACLAVTAGCRAGRDLEVADTYVAALRAGRLEDAYAQLSETQRGRVPFAKFKARYADAAERQRRAGQLALGARSWMTQEGTLAISHGTDGNWRLQDLSLEFDPRDTLRNFVQAVEMGDFSRAHRLLSAEWRSYYSVSRFQHDFEREPTAKRHLARAKAWLALPPHYTASGAQWVDASGAVTLVLEADGYRVAALE